jgi:hypothetical protein
MNYYQSYKKIRKTIFTSILEVKVTILDVSHFGCATRKLSPKTVVIFVYSGMSFKYMCFTIAHELGHYFNIVKGKWKFVSNRNNFSEKEANRNALKILKFILNKDFSEEYVIFYDKIKEKNNKMIRKIEKMQPAMIYDITKDRMD